MAELRLYEVARWLRNRKENCLRIGATKTDHEEVRGWLIDAELFTAAEAAVDLASDQGFDSVIFQRPVMGNMSAPEIPAPKHKPGD